MKINVSWLRRYVEITEDPRDLANDLTMFGVNVENVTALAPEFKGVVYGKVLEVKKHPKADRLTMCTVDVGGARPLGVICGAPNVRAGLAVPVALDGAVLAGGVTIKRSKIRGEVSEGMICSEIELGVGDDAAGIMQLDFEEKPGTSLEGRLGETSYIFDVEVTPNRPDLLSHFGIAREVAALYRRELRTPELFPLEAGEAFDLTIESGRDCPRYTAVLVEGVNVAQSPPWMQRLLSSVGMRSINNIVDATNFVLMELGQPLHAFDRDRLAKDAIVVRRAREGETITTLDGVLRACDPGILVIADAERPVAIAGVMGGHDAEVSEATKRILIESAMFDPKLIRRARQRFKLDTEASYRFEREGDVGVMLQAAARAAWLIADMGAGTPLPRCSDAIGDPRSLEPRSIHLRTSQVNRLMGTALDAADVSALLERLELPSRPAGDGLDVTIPSVRRDLREEIDLVEETARVYGYERIGLDEAAHCSLFASASPSARRDESIIAYLAARGFAEVITSSFMDPGDPGRMGWDPADERSRPLVLQNPLTENQSTLRTSLIPGLLGVVKRNGPAECEEIRICELGKIFVPAAAGSGLPREEHHLAGLIARRAGPLQWLEKERQADFFDMKGELESLLEQLGFTVGLAMSSARERSGRLFRWQAASAVVAEGGPISEAASGRFDVDFPIFYFDVNLNQIPVEGLGWPAYGAVSPYPAVKRDLCIVVDQRVSCAEVRGVIVRNSKLLDSLRLFDYYRGGHLGEGKRSYTFRMSFRSAEGTLDGVAVDQEVQRILGALQRELQAILRTE
jgi:phenylalanyl-tRNA synthetase beta chain